MQRIVVLLGFLLLAGGVAEATHWPGKSGLLVPRSDIVASVTPTPTPTPDPVPPKTFVPTPVPTRSPVTTVTPIPPTPPVTTPTPTVDPEPTPTAMPTGGCSTCGGGPRKPGVLCPMYCVNQAPQ
jgi:hypothetical protein